MKKNGFTYIEVMIALAIFSIFIMFLMNINHNSAKMASNRRIKLKELYIAQMEMERWKSDYGDEVTEYYIEITDNFIEYKDLSGGKFKVIDITDKTENLEINDKFYVSIKTERLGASILDIVVLVKNEKDQDNSEGQKLESHIFMN